MVTHTHVSADAAHVHANARSNGSKHAATIGEAALFLTQDAVSFAVYGTWTELANLGERIVAEVGRAFAAMIDAEGDEGA